MLIACGGKDEKSAKETAEIKATCEKIVALEERELGTEPAPATSAGAASPRKASVLAELRRLTEVLGSSAPMTVPAQTRCAADMHLYRAASPTGFTCLDGCAKEGAYAAMKACFEKCVAEDEPFEKARRESRKQREVNARNWLGAASSQATTAVTGKVVDAKGREWALNVDLPDQPQADGPGKWRIEKTSALVAPTINVALVEPSGTLQDAALAAVADEALVEHKQQEKKGRFHLVRVGPDTEMSRAGASSKNRDRLVSQVVFDKDDIRIVCTVQASLLDLDDGLINAATVWTENLCNSVALKP